MSQVADVVTDKITEVGVLVDQMDQVFNDTAVVRKQIQDKLLTGLSEMKLDPNGDPETLEAQLKLLTSLDAIAGAREKAFTTRVNTRMKKQEQEDTSKYLSALVAETLSKVNTQYVPSANQEVSASSIEEIEKKMAELPTVEYDNGALRMDSKDLSE